MKSCRFLALLLFSATAGSRACAEEPANCEPTQPGFLQRVAPAGGWFPYGGGLLHWWNPHCFPCYCGPDDYCRKPLPCVCWPAYPSFYGWGTSPAAPEQLPQPKPESYPAGLPPPHGQQPAERTP